MPTPALQAPGPGGWEIDATHFPHPPSALARDVYTKTFPTGLAAGFEAMGLTLETLQYREVDGFLYSQPKVVGAPAGGAPPPGVVLWLISRLHPAIRTRNARVEQVWSAATAWGADAQSFLTEHRPRLIARHRALLEEPLEQMDDAGLLDHAARAIAAYHQAAWVHGRFTVTCQIPMGDFLVHAHAWTGRQPAELLRLVAGHAPASSGLSAELLALVAALREAPTSAPTLDLDDAEGTLNALCAAPEPIGAAARAWIALVGWRVIEQYDPAQPTALEYPFLLVATLLAAMEGRLRVPEADERALQEIRDAVPAQERPSFDTLLAQARSVAGLRDERTLYADYWAAGVVRRAALAIGARLVARGRLPRAALACEAAEAELATLLAGQGPSSDELEARARARQRWAHDAPQTLGEVAAMPDPSVFPAATARGLRATFMVMAAVFNDCPAPITAEVVRGFPVSAGLHEGTARVVQGPQDFHRLRRGDVLVASMTTPAYNVVLPLLGALVTDRGGALSHAAIVSREFGIPGVVGCRQATRVLPDGARVRVDGTAGTVTVLGAR